MKRLTFYVLFLIITFLCEKNVVYGYSYAEKEDPIALIFKDALVSAKDGDWNEVSRLAEKGIFLLSKHNYKADKVKPLMKKAINNQDIPKTAEVFANLVYLSILEKLNQNKDERLSNYSNARARLQLAYKSYLDILDGNVKKEDSGRSKAIVKYYNDALNSIGNPGLFGIGAKKPDLDKYSLSVRKITELLKKSFPGF